MREITREHRENSIRSGGNAGIETPYVYEPVEPPDPGPLMPYYPIFRDAPIINLQSPARDDLLKITVELEHSVQFVQVRQRKEIRQVRRNLHV